MINAQALSVEIEHALSGCDVLAGEDFSRSKRFVAETMNELPQITKVWSTLQNKADEEDLPELSQMWLAEIIPGHSLTRHVHMEPRVLMYPQDSRLEIDGGHILTPAFMPYIDSFLKPSLRV